MTGSIYPYTRRTFVHDLIAGLTVAAIALPQAMAYALNAGIRPQYGIYTAIVTTILASCLYSSSYLIAGPTNAVSLVVYSAVAGMTAGPDDPQRIQVVCLLGLLVGLIQVLIAVLRLGDLTRYVSESVVLGFMAGAALLIALAQLPNLLGIHLREAGHGRLVFRLWQMFYEGAPINHRAVGIAIGTIAAVILLRRVRERLAIPLPHTLLVLAAASICVWALGWAPANDTDTPLVECIGEIPTRLPPFELPQVQRREWIRELELSPLALALLGLVESFAIAKALAGRAHQRLDFNRQALAEGLANMGGSLFHCMPGAGSLTRSAINYQAGAMTRLSGIISGIAVAGVLLVCAPLARYVPKPALAAILVATAWTLVDRPRLRYCVRATRFDAALALATACSAVLIGIEFSILIGIFLSFLFFVPRAARLQASELVISAEGVIRERLPDDPHCTKLVLLALEGEMFFGAAPELDEYLNGAAQRVKEGAKVVVLRLKRARNPDMVCLERMQRFIEHMHEVGVTVLLCGVRQDFAKALRNLRFHHWLPPECVFLEEVTTGSSTLRAVRRAYELLGEERCPNCPRALEPPQPARRDWYYMI